MVLAHPPTTARLGAFDSPAMRLDTAAEQIRVLELHAGCYDEPLVCHTSVVSLAANPTYAALSYCWGDPNVTEPITFNGVADFPVTANLASALRHYRKTDGLLFLWVDAVCINQQDSAEKNVQVKLMGEIYKNASHTFIWLGSAADNSDRAMGCIGALDDTVIPEGRRPTIGELALISLLTTLRLDPCHRDCCPRFIYHHCIGNRHFRSTWFSCVAIRLFSRPRATTSTSLRSRHQSPSFGLLPAGVGRPESRPPRRASRLGASHSRAAATAFSATI